MSTSEPKGKYYGGGSIRKKPSEGPIETTAIYPLDDFLRRTRWGRAALATAKRNGLRILKVGGTGFVFGADFQAYLEKMTKK